MSATRKRINPPGLSKIQNQDIKKKRSSICSYPSSSTSSSSTSSSSTSQCHSSAIHLSSPMQLRKRKKLDKQRLQVHSPCKCAHTVATSDSSQDQQVPGDMEKVDLEQPALEQGLFGEDYEVYTTWPNQQSERKVPEHHNRTTPKGHFGIFPNEVFSIVLSYLLNSDLSSLSLTSREMNAAVRDYSCTQQGCKHILHSMPPMVEGVGHLLSASPCLDENGFAFPFDPKQDSIMDVVKQFEDLGILMKKLTILLPPKSRVKVASFFLNKLDSTHQALVALLGHSAAYFSFGRLFFTFIRGWSNPDKIKAYNLLRTVAKLEQRVKKVVLSAPSSLNVDERDVRWLHRHVFLDHAIVEGEQSYAFWLSHILKPWPITCQARLLYLLTAPHDSQGFISWTLACGCSNLQHLSGTVDFSELANSLRVLLQHCSRDWTMNDIISIIDELTTTPNGWCLENVAQLLIHCGSGITKGVLTSRATNGHVDELSVICFYLGNTCCALEGRGTTRNNVNISWFLEVVRTTVSVLPQTISKAAFLSSIVSKWQDYLVAIFEDSSPDDADSDQIQVDFFNTLGNFTKIASRLLQTVLDVDDSE